MTEKYRFKFKDNGTIVNVQAMDVKEMVKNSHDWECMDDVSDILLGDAADKIPRTLHIKNGNRKNLA